MRNNLNTGVREHLATTLVVHRECLSSPEVKATSSAWISACQESNKGSYIFPNTLQLLPAQEANCSPCL